MMTSWKDIAKIVAPYAPTVGELLGGLAPIPGGGTIGKWAGELLARQFGVEPTPEAVASAIQAESANPASLQAKLDAAEIEAAEKWRAFAEVAKADAADRTAQATVLNETIRTETAAGVSWWHWRHLIGYATLLWSIAVLPPFVLHLWTGNATALQAVTAALTSAIPFFGILAGLNGYIAQDSTKLKETAITGQTRDGVVASAVKAATGKR